jgi:hypothetical protein
LREKDEFRLRPWLTLVKAKMPKTLNSSKLMTSTQKRVTSSRESRSLKSCRKDWTRTERRRGALEATTCATTSTSKR